MEEFYSSERERVRKREGERERERKRERWRERDKELDRESVREREKSKERGREMIQPGCEKIKRCEINLIPFCAPCLNSFQPFNENISNLFRI